MAELRAFVIMPFDEEFDAVYSDLIAPPLTEAGFVVKRADDVADRQNVLADIVRGVADADLIIADLTTANANVFYELGLAHAMGVPTILIAHQASADDIPFDLRQYRTEFYDTHFQRAKTIIMELEKIARLHAQGDVVFGSPISDFLPGASRPTLRAQRTEAMGVPARDSRDHGRTSDVKSGSDDDAGEDDHGQGKESPPDDRGIIDYLEALDEAAQALQSATDPVVAAITTVGKKIEQLTDRIERTDPTAPGAPAKIKRIILQAAELLDSFAAEMEARQPDLEAAVDAVTSSGLGYITLIAETPDQWADELESVLDTSTELRDSVVGASEGVTGFRDSVAGLPPMIKQTNRARNRTVRGLEALLAQFDRVRSYADQSIGLVHGAQGRQPPATHHATSLSASRKSESPKASAVDETQ